MNKKTQAGIEYLMTYGWALILVVTVIGVLVFIVSTPIQDVTFRSSDPTKLIMKGATALAEAVQIKLQNITGGKITITELTSLDYANLTINGQIPPIDILAGAEFVIEGNGTTGTITITYTDYAGIERTVTITGSDGSPSAPAAFDPGLGTQDEPFNIGDCDALQAIDSGDLGAYYQLTQSFSCSGIVNFDPIGDSGAPFTGNFDGQGFTISGLTINRSGEDYVGLFGYTGSGASISNVGLTGININGRFNTGGLVGKSIDGGSITNSYSTGSVDGGWYVGGLVGFSTISIANSYSTASVTGINGNIGGLIGYSNAPVTTSYSTGNVDGDNSPNGGLIGYNNAPVTNSYSTGNVNGSDSTGGLIGFNKSTVTNTYSTGNVDGGWYVGGLVGDNYSVVSNSYSTGSVTGIATVGGLVGYNEDSISNGYWYNLQPTCDWFSNAGCPTDGPENAAEDFFNTSHSVYVGTSPWDFGTIWNGTGSSYPTLQ